MTTDVTPEPAAPGDAIRAPEVIAITGATYRQLEYWRSQGWLGTGRVGPDRCRTFTSRDAAVITYALALIKAGLMARPAVATAARIVDTGQPAPLADGLVWVYPVLQPRAAEGSTEVAPRTPAPTADEEATDCANCGQPIRRTTADDGYDTTEVAWTHTDGAGMFCDLGPPRATPGGDGWG